MFKSYYWNRINKKAAYIVHFDSSELITKCIQTLDKELRVTPLQYRIQSGEQKDDLSYDEMSQGEGFTVTSTTTEENRKSIHSAVKYDLIGKLAESAQLTRRTITKILAGLAKPVYFVAETKGTMSTMEMRDIEEIKIKCARKFFYEINKKINPKNVKYDMVKSYGTLMDIVGVSAAPCQ